MSNVQSWVSRALALGAVGFVAWLGLPALPSPDPWPTPAETETGLKPLLAQDLGQAWGKKEYQRSWEAARLIDQLFPQSAEAARLKPLAPQMEQLALREQLAGKWRYNTVSSAGWGTLNEAQITAEQPQFNPDASPSFLLLRTGDLARYRAVYLVPGQALPADCAHKTGCVLQVQHGQGTSSVRWLPVEGQEGWWQASNPEQTLGWLVQKSRLEMTWVGQQEPLRFESGELDLIRMGLQSALSP